MPTHQQRAKASRLRTAAQLEIGELYPAEEKLVEAVLGSEGEGALAGPSGED